MEEIKQCVDGSENQDEVISQENNDQEQCCKEVHNALQSCQEAQQEWKNKFVSLSADYANYKRRIEQDQTQWIANAQSKLILDLLPIIDNFERALEVSSSEQNEAWQKGIEMVYADLEKVLKKYQVTEVDCTQAFNPEIHEALMQVEADQPSGAIVTVLQKGYMRGEMVLRPAKVSVAK